MNAESVLLKGNELQERIATVLARGTTDGRRPTAIVLSFDLYCLLIEYSFLVDQLQNGDLQSIEELLTSETLLFNTGLGELAVRVDFSAPAGTVTVE